MKRILSMSCVLAALACGSVKDKAQCSVSTDCPAGQYCARAGGEARCWADSVAPVVGAVIASCGAEACKRDGVLHVEAEVTDDAEVLDAAVVLDFATGSPKALHPSNGKWVADVNLRELPFPFYARTDVVAKVTARDGARNASNEGTAGGIGVTRLRWERLIEPGGAVVTPTAPAVQSDGTVVIGGSDGKLYFVAPDKTDAHAPLTVATGPISAAPAVGANTIWVGSEDFTLYGVAPDGSAAKPGVGLNASGAIRGSVAVMPGAGKEWAFVTAATGYAGVASTTPGDRDLAGPAATFLFGPVVASDGRMFAGTSVSSATLRAFTLDTAAAVLNQQWSTAISLNLAGPLAIDGTGAIWAGTADRQLSKIVPGDTSGTVVPVAVLPGAIVDSPVILASGDIVVGDDTGSIHRYSSTGTQVWTALLNPGDHVFAPLVLANADAKLFVPTFAGRLFARADDGSAVWATTLDEGNSLRVNIFTPAGQTGNVISTAYVSSSSGKLFAIIVDGQLDSAAPWPKAFHDPRNTNRAGPQP